MNDSQNIAKYTEIMERYRNGEFGYAPQTLYEILNKAGEPDLFEKFSREELQTLANRSTGLTRMMFSLLLDKKTAFQG